MIELPLFPLNAALLPGGVLPLRIFETRYLDMIGRCLREDGSFGVVLIRSGRDTGAAPIIYRTGTTAKLIDWERLENGLLGVTAQGERKFELRESRIEKDRLMTGQVELLEAERRVALPAEYASLAEVLERILAGLPGSYQRLKPDLGDAGWVGGRLVELLPLKVPLKQRLIELDDPLVRLAHLHEAIQAQRFV